MDTISGGLLSEKVYCMHARSKNLFIWLGCFFKPPGLEPQEPYPTLIFKKGYLPYHCLLGGGKMIPFFLCMGDLIDAYAQPNVLTLLVYELKSFK